MGQNILSTSSRWRRGVGSYLSFAGLIALAAVGGAVKQGLDKPRFLFQGVAGVVGFAVVAGLGLLLPKLARTKTEAQDSAALEDIDPWDR